MSSKRVKLLRIATVSMSFRLLLKGQLKFMSQYFETHAASSPGWELDELETYEATEVHPIAMERVPSPVKDLISLRKLIALSKRLKPEIVHTHTPKAGLLGMLAARITGVPIRLHTVAGIPWMESQGRKRKVLRFVERLTYRFATHVYSNSFALKDFILENGLLPKHKISVIANGSSNGINTNWYSRKEEVMLQTQALKLEWGLTNEKVILFVGRLVKDKGIEELLEAYQKLKGTHNLKLLLVGPFEEDRAPLSASAIKMIEEDVDIITTGYVKDVRPYMALSYLLAFPSYREGFPNVPMQAGAMGLPSIVTDINGCNEIVEHEVNGLIIEPKSVDHLKKAISRLLTDEALYDKMAINARPMIAKRYEQNLIWEALLNEYRFHLRNSDEVI
jgi:glycosyltransferase involved in cell wall biosynthesis